MLRSITGYVKLTGDDWDFHRRMNSKLEFVFEQLLAPQWEEELLKRKAQTKERLEKNECNPLVCQVYRWNPETVKDNKLNFKPRSSRGRPRVSWDGLL